MNKRLKAGLIGLGRIGNIHLQNLSRHPDVEKISICAPSAKRESYPRFQLYRTYQELIQKENPDILFICSPTPTHYEIIAECCQLGIDVFCEKPIDLDLGRIQELKKYIDESGIILQVGFNRRFDPDFSSLKNSLEEKALGKIYQITITSRDPGFPSLDYIASSGGMFMDMTIHDFDMCRFLTGSEISEIYTKGQIRINQELTKYNDIDTATTILTFQNEITTTIINSRDAIYGYDQRIEVFGSKGLITVDNHRINNISIADYDGKKANRPVSFFLERYALSYIAEVDEFIKTILRRGKPSVSIDDALKATEIAVYANQSLALKKVIKL